MSLKDSFNGDSCKDFLNRFKSSIGKNSAIASDKIKTLISDFKTQLPDFKNLISKSSSLKLSLSKIADGKAFKTIITDLRIEKLSKLSRNAKIGIGAGVLGVVVIGSVLILNPGQDVYQLTIAGEEAGYIADTETVSAAIEEIKADLSKEAGGAEIVVDDNAIAVKETDLKANKITFLSNDELKELILSADLFKASIWAVNINGSNVVAAATESDANAILDGVKRHYLTEGSEIIDAGFKEAVSVTKAAMNAAEIMKPEDAVNLIITGTKEPKVYTVQDGDTLWDIAIANNMTPEELQTANPGFDPNRLKIGQQLNLFQVKPYVTVLTKEIVAATEKIDFKTVYENTGALYKGEVKVKSAGVYGTKEVKTEVTKENGTVVASVELDSVVTAEPQDQIALRGTKSIATFTGSGSLSSPMGRIEVSSPFGSRGGGRHTGVDLRNPKGTPIKAADDGVVTFAAYSGTYGNIVKLSHGNGLETWYAHCDTIKVSVGQVVSKGEVIATVGITGRATGYHLHFEVRKNGVPQNPMNYL
jgi:murein DD-endopeptidase MepM/ murein hydrolase activator NlpD